MRSAYYNTKESLSENNFCPSEDKNNPQIMTLCSSPENNFVSCKTPGCQARFWEVGTRSYKVAVFLREGRFYFTQLSQSAGPSSLGRIAPFHV
uniref:Uncharacterized protein n=1 Tax=Monomastix sp. (strain OKE-1) TaxID=141716 RepID=U5YGI6_MONSK|nr:hypothetical protein [Monomastix sp. OKE-1]AGZ90181.1 hypothetical protein [Monomastix sp. OKE-1]